MKVKEIVGPQNQPLPTQDRILPQREMENGMQKLAFKAQVSMLQVHLLMTKNQYNALSVKGGDIQDDYVHPS